MKKLIAIAIASALVAPSALAAEDELGMRYTSASEGLYASIRTEWTSGASEDDTGSFDDSGSRFGIQGTNDLGGGLEGFYNYEASVGANNGDAVTTRLRYVGLRGAFGDVRFGTVWDDTYNFVTSKSDMSPNDSGRFAWYFRSNNAGQYTTPDLNGFQAGVRIIATNGDDEDNQIDNWALVGQYSIAGFNVSGAYENIVDGFDAYSYNGGAAGIDSTPATGANPLKTGAKDDQNRWAVGASYAQDNWYVGGWYGETAQRGVAEGTARTALAEIPAGTGATRNIAGADAVTALTAGQGGLLDKALETLSIGGNVTVDKVVVYAVYETRSNNIAGGNKLPGSAAAGATDAVKAEDAKYFDNSGANVGVIYNIGSQSRIWVEYVSQDNDAPDSTADDYINIGMRHNF